VAAAVVAGRAGPVPAAVVAGRAGPVPAAVAAGRAGPVPAAGAVVAPVAAKVVVADALPEAR
jgi:hypothetical protein